VRLPVLERDPPNALERRLEASQLSIRWRTRNSSRAADSSRLLVLARSYITVESFDYYSDGTFTIGYWFTKERCTGGIYEYLYSHNQHRNTMDTSNINIYLGCEEAGGGFTNLYNPSAPTGDNRVGSTMRFSFTDTGGRSNAAEAVWDYPLHDAHASQDSILNIWMHVAVAVDVPAQSFKTFIDGNGEQWKPELGSKSIQPQAPPPPSQPRLSSPPPG